MAEAAVEIRCGLRIVAGIKGNSLSADAMMRRFLDGESIASVALLYGIRQQVVEGVMRWYFKHPSDAAQLIGTPS